MNCSGQFGQRVAQQPPMFDQPSAVANYPVIGCGFAHGYVHDWTWRARFSGAAPVHLRSAASDYSGVNPGLPRRSLTCRLLGSLRRIPFSGPRQAKLDQPADRFASAADAARERLIIDRLHL
jgi:hypothetical protein